MLIVPFNNIKGAGVVALLNEGAGKKGLALVIHEAGNTDTLFLATVDGDPAKKGKLKTLVSVPALEDGINGKKLVPPDHDRGSREPHGDGEGLQAQRASRPEQCPTRRPGRRHADVPPGRRCPRA